MLGPRGSAQVRGHPMDVEERLVICEERSARGAAAQAKAGHEKQHSQRLLGYSGGGYEAETRVSMNQASDGNRLVLLDALRGFASCWVAVAHIFTNSRLQPIFLAHMPATLAAPLEHGGHLGVMMFFVLSGFVIAHSVQPYRVTGRFIAEFAARRSLRLDPPYWAVLVGMIGLNAISNLILTDRTAAIPSWSTLVINLTYLQGVLGQPSVLGVAWTLCLEVQFYLLFVAGLGIATRSGASHVERTASMIFLPLAAISILSPFLRVPLPGWLQYWYAFAAGALTCWALARRVPAAAPFVAAAILITGAASAGSADAAMAGTTVLGIALAGRKGWLHRTGGRALQRLGALSYSLYLVHTVVATPIEDLGYRLTGTSLAGAVTWAAAAFAASLFAAALTRRHLEEPSLRLAGRLRGWHQRHLPSLPVEVAV